MTARKTLTRSVPSAISLVLLVTGFLGSMSPSVAAHQAEIGDPKDVLSERYRHALDIRSASMGHDADGITHMIMLYRGFGEENGLKGDFYLGVAFDTDGDARDVERVLFIVSFEGHLVGQMVKEDGRRAGSFFSVEHPTARKAVATFAPRLLGGPDSYRWFAFANSPFDDRCCFDTAPNRKWVVHDIGVPEITEPNLLPPADSTWENSIVPVDFGVVDVGGSGLDSWSLRQRALGTTTWMTSDTGTGEGPQTASLTGADGTSYHVCIQAADRAGNIANGDHHLVSFPFDDAGSGFTYSGLWQTSSVAGDYQSTRHTSSEPGATGSVTFSTLGYPYIVMPPGFDGVARVTLNGIDQGSFPASVITSTRQVRAFGVDFVDIGNATAPYTITFTVESGTFPIDGLLVLPSLPPPALGPPPACG